MSGEGSIFRYCSLKQGRFTNTLSLYYSLESNQLIFPSYPQRTKKTMNSYLAIILRILLEKIAALLFTFISLQHILVSLSKFLLLGTVCRQETRYETGHGGC